MNLDDVFLQNQKPLLQHYDLQVLDLQKEQLLLLWVYLKFPEIMMELFQRTWFVKG